MVITSQSKPKLINKDKFAIVPAIFVSKPSSSENSKTLMPTGKITNAIKTLLINDLGNNR